jgi:chromosome segregation ATPase
LNQVSLAEKAKDVEIERLTT